MAVLRLLLFCALVLALWPAPLLRAAGPRGLSEQELKAAALYQVLHFTRWPAGAFTSPSDPLVVGIFGEDPFGTLIDELVAGENASGHPIKIVRIFTPEAAADCHVVYVASADDRAATRLIHLLRNSSVLTVGDSETFCERGGIVALTVRNNRIRVLVNLDVAQKTDVTLSSKLLRLAEIVKGKR